jgi:hypothetical protein
MTGMWERRRLVRVQRAVASEQQVQGRDASRRCGAASVEGRIGVVVL